MGPSSDASAERSAIVDLAALVGLAGIVAGATLLGPTDVGFEWSAAIAAVASWLPTTLPIAVIALAASAVDIGAGVVLARAIRGRPFGRLDDALLQGFVAAVIKDVALLGLLAGVGLFDQVVLAILHAVVLAAGVARLRPILAPDALPRPFAGGAVAISPFAVLVGVAWAAPILLQAASPIVPFMDILPNHVAPAEHLRTFGTLTHLTDTQSPIYGPSRIFLGYTALLGTITTLSGLPAGAVLAGFILPSTILVGVAVHRLATAVGGVGPGAGIGHWALLTFAMTTSLARLGDARATVVVLPLVAWALALVGDRLAADSGSVAWTARRLGRPFPEGVILGLALGAAILVHPVIGFLAALTVGIAVLVQPERLTRLAVPALGCAAVLALPQAATMLGFVLPTALLVAALALAIAVGLALDRLLGDLPVVGTALVGMARLAAAAAVVLGILFAGAVVRAAIAGASPLLMVLEVSGLLTAVAVALRTPASRSLVVWAALAAGFGVATFSQLVPAEGSGLLGDALRFELPKTLQYWVPVFVAILAAAGLAALVDVGRAPLEGRLSLVIRTVALVAFVVAIALPIRPKPIDAFHLGEHRLSETFSIAMRWVERGFFAGFPDSRSVVDAPRQELLDAVRAEIEAGRLGADTPVLHVAGSFQMWAATPLGVLDGVTETILVPEPEVSIHTVGGRILDLDALPELLAQVGPPGAAYPYVVLEPDPNGMPPGIRDEIVAAGYASIFANGQGELFVFQR
ncbi:MAG: hypothetical protein EPO36_10455 [Chloroflexota bacterium]|nr:MAG: hypothetical protein EPO36_10455 [Chloroflexota bacterium]